MHIDYGERAGYRDLSSGGIESGLVDKAFFERSASGFLRLKSGDKFSGV